MKVKERIEKIVDFLVKTLEPERIILFGSRAGNLEKPFSDIDLAIEGGREVSFREFRKIKENLDQLAGIYSVDIIFLKKVNPDFKSIVLQTGRVIYEKGRSPSGN
ncbi:nucleotidyltransferase domain-containing protein [Thermodesulfobacterium hydrogeniphilum]|uniref:nucleotidyltransferase domain-containing protein n=1 Tax=Thermodesulfobacterium hydrogeniphilum TaxID=161156 RepID=UPI00056FC615|nr:nucleotidyltransferase domain-containing protein [Thermodesulfobacterium hydrogeniphilum]